MTAASDRDATLWQLKNLSGVLAGTRRTASGVYQTSVGQRYVKVSRYRDAEPGRDRALGQRPGCRPCAPATAPAAGDRSHVHCGGCCRHGSAASSQTTAAWLRWPRHRCTAGST